ncbi:hypothetical protein ACFYVL_20600 [Streptomyces sp. NPDC004111]|uniref:hypothetical protein n=1 Tax=Streptomyces sp. NPDC004111 TaxID=3364690 RepID=UPI0036B51F00
MRSLKIATGTALASTALLFTAPLASAADTQCDPATAAAMEAESAYKAALADYQKQVDGGGHPGKAEQDNVDQLKQKSDSAASEAQRICGDTTMNPSHNTHPRGAMHTGTGGSSDGSATPIALGLGAAGVLAAAVLMKGRRRGDSQA